MNWINFKEHQSNNVSTEHSKENEQFNCKYIHQSYEMLRLPKFVRKTKRTKINIGLDILTAREHVKLPVLKIMKNKEKCSQSQSMLKQNEFSVVFLDEMQRKNCSEVEFNRKNEYMQANKKRIRLAPISIGQMINS